MTSSPGDIEGVLVPIDFGPTTESAIAWGAACAESLGAWIELFHVWHFPIFPSADAGWVPPPEQLLGLEAVASATLETTAALLRERHPALSVRTCLRSGNALQEILERLNDRGDKTVAVLGTRARGFWSRLLLGSVARGVVAESPTPVLTVHEGSFPPGHDSPRRAVIVGVDFDDTSMPAIDWGIALAIGLGREVRVLFGHTVPGGEDAPVTDDGTAELAESSLGRVASRIIDHHRIEGVAIDFALSTMPPVEAMVEQASAPDVGLVVLGVHSNGAFHSLYSRDVAVELSRRAPCPVLTCAATRRSSSHPQPQEADVAEGPLFGLAAFDGAAPTRRS